MTTHDAIQLYPYGNSRRQSVNRFFTSISTPATVPHDATQSADSREKLSDCTSVRPSVTLVNCDHKH